MLSIDEREEISRGIAAGGTLRSIAVKLHRAPSTISRELRRNGGLGRYRAAAADQRAWHRALRPKPCKLARHDQLRQLVAARLEENWSPEQIAGWLKHTYPDDEAYRVSHETRTTKEAWRFQSTERASCTRRSRISVVNRSMSLLPAAGAYGSSASRPTKKLAKLAVI